MAAPVVSKQQKALQAWIQIRANAPPPSPPSPLKHGKKSST